MIENKAERTISSELEQWRIDEGYFLFFSFKINKNGFLSFTQITNPTLRNNTGSDIIAPLWNQFSTPSRNIFYEEITSGSVLDDLTKQVNDSYPSVGFTASWAFIVMFDHVSFASVSGVRYLTILKIKILVNDEISDVLMNNFFLFF